MAVPVAEEADVVVLVLGLCGNNNAGEDPDGNCATESETEGLDRKGLKLPGRQLELMDRVLKAAAADGTTTTTGTTNTGTTNTGGKKKDVVLVMINAGPVDISAAKDKIQAIVWAG